MRSSSVDFYVIETLKSKHCHLTSHEVYEIIQKQLPAVNPSTVYRSLERLVKEGKVSISDMGTGSEVYEIADGEVHHHLVCQKCGKTITISAGEVNSFFEAMEKQHHFHVLTNHLILFGICEECQKAPSSNSTETTN